MGLWSEALPQLLLHGKGFFFFKKTHIFQNRQIDDTTEWVMFQHSNQMTKGLVYFILTQLVTTFQNKTK